ncbi:hypothetical protein PQR57_04105 [Paraburkholderia dipogonis]|uniref:Uncharacterized protein n=1 Tax=Paraburkholderia dipogonis TaxID=1211383 RepID=A0ABW9AHW3_9BURK
MSKTATAIKILLFIVLTPILIAAGIYAMVNTVDYAERRFNPEEYWGKKATEEERNFNTLDQSLRGCLIELEAKRRTYSLDVASSVNAGLTNQDAVALANIGLEGQIQGCAAVSTMRKQSAESLASYRGKALQK